MTEQVLIATILGAVFGWVGASLEHIATLRRMMQIEAFLRGLYGQKAKREKKEQTDAFVQAALQPRLDNELDIMAEARRRGLLHGQ